MYMIGKNVEQACEILWLANEWNDVNNCALLMNIVITLLYIISCFGDSLPICFLYLDLLMISNLVFVGADDYVEGFGEVQAMGC